MDEAKSYVNTDRELWREKEEDYYAPSIHVTEEGKIGIAVGGTVHVKDVRRWHELAEVDMEMGLNGPSCLSMANPDQSWKYTNYLQVLLEVQKSGHSVHDEINGALAKLKEITFGEGA